MANVGDTRSYFIRQKTIRRLTTDHVATALPVKLGPDARAPGHGQSAAQPAHAERGRRAVLPARLATQFLHHGDFILHCTDGLHAFVLDEEMREIISRSIPYDACKELVALAREAGKRRQHLPPDDRGAQLGAGRADRALQHRHHDATPSKKAGGSRPRRVTGSGEPAPGKVLDGRFELTDLVARSNMASIFKANDRKTGQSVAIKVPLMALESDIAGFERFQREEEIGARLNHPSILKVIKVEEAKSRPYLVMEFLDGKTLADVISQEEAASGGARPSPTPARSATRLSTSTQNGITHRDLKPQNIMVCKDGSLRLFDFGIARVETARRLTFVGLTPDPRHARLHLARAGQGQARRPPQRHLQPRRHPLRDGDRRDARSRARAPTWS